MTNKEFGNREALRHLEELRVRLLARSMEQLLDLVHFTTSRHTRLSRLPLFREQRLCSIRSSLELTILAQRLDAPKLLSSMETYPCEGGKVLFHSKRNHLDYLRILEGSKGVLGFWAIPRRVVRARATRKIPVTI